MTEQYVLIGILCYGKNFYVNMGRKRSYNVIYFKWQHDTSIEDIFIYLIFIKETKVNSIEDI